MKGTIFVKPLEYNIIAEGEKWRQGDKIKGQISIKNHSAETINLDLVNVSLALGNYKKVKAKDKKAFGSIDKKVLAEKLSIEASGDKEFTWEFTLDEDCPITDKNGSIYLLFNNNNNDDSYPLGQLELGISPKIVMTQFLEILVTFLRFKIVQTKFSKGMVEVKLNPPSSRELSHVESLVLRMREVNKTLDLEYCFNMQVFETVAGNMIVQKKTKEFTQQLTSKQYYVYGDSPNHEFIKSSVEAIIKEATPRIFTPS
jgi:sporulation-control protein spo0M